MKRKPTKWFAKHSYWHWADIIWRRLHKVIFDIVLTLHHLFQFHEWNTLASYNEQSISSVYWTIYIVLHQPIVYPSANFSLNVKVTMVLEKMIVCAKKFCDWRKIYALVTNPQTDSNQFKAGCQILYFWIGVIRTDFS